MIRTYSTAQGRLHPDNMAADPDLDATWIDLLNPEPDETSLLGEHLGITIPDRADTGESQLGLRL